MKKFFCFLVLFVFVIEVCFFTSNAAAVNRADSTDHLRVPEFNVYKVAYGDEACRKALAVLPINHRAGFSIFSGNSQAGSFTQLRGTGQINKNINIGICFEQGEVLESYSKQTIGLDLTFWEDKFAIGTVLPLQGNDANISLRHTERSSDDLSATSFVAYRTKGVWDFGLDINWRPVKIEAAYNDQKKFAGEAKYNIPLKWGTLSPGVFHENNITGGIISFMY